jgi:hypothetical protein
LIVIKSDCNRRRQQIQSSFPEPVIISQVLDWIIGFTAVFVLRHFGGSAASIFSVKAQAEQATSTNHTERIAHEGSVSDADSIGLGRSPEISGSSKEHSNCCWHFLLFGLQAGLENGPKRRCISTGL